ncbi:uncharacterized protein LOC116292658 isoform X1 [Actinia tenebrosa]|uniref:Uncharacterized protein LOC116292658 isoform X1 n=1 Tax=Actinia tenebrosa TaxID=6105 RepID=A0A6P8HLP1_ACTTE|nr:uncharacterized protein LOC116292658 isoform X1 [Actinia tenebrosa]
MKSASPDQLAAFSNKTLCKEIEVNCPIYSSVVRGACGYHTQEEDNPKASNAIAVATSALVRVNHPNMSAVAYRISTILFHSGISKRDLTRLNHLGVCMSPQMLISLHQKMGENFDYKVLSWKKEIEKSRSALLFINEIQEKMIPKRAVDDMEVEIQLDLSEENLNRFKCYSFEVYKHSMSILENEKKLLAESSFTEEVVTQAQHRLQKEKLPTYKIVGDNIDPEITARLQTKQHSNRSLHWTQSSILTDICTGHISMHCLTRSQTSILKGQNPNKVQSSTKSYLTVGNHC